MDNLLKDHISPYEYRDDALDLTHNVRHSRHLTEGLSRDWAKCKEVRLRSADHVGQAIPPEKLPAPLHPAAAQANAELGAAK